MIFGTAILEGLKHTVELQAAHFVFIPIDPRQDRDPTFSFYHVDQGMSWYMDPSEKPVPMRRAIEAYTWLCDHVSDDRKAAT